MQTDAYKCNGLHLSVFPFEGGRLLWQSVKKSMQKDDEFEEQIRSRSLYISLRVGKFLISSEHCLTRDLGRQSWEKVLQALVPTSSTLHTEANCLKGSQIESRYPRLDLLQICAREQALRRKKKVGRGERGSDEEGRRKLPQTRDCYIYLVISSSYGMHHLSFPVPFHCEE